MSKTLPPTVSQPKNGSPDATLRQQSSRILVFPTLLEPHRIAFVLRCSSPLTTSAGNARLASATKSDPRRIAGRGDVDSGRMSRKLVLRVKPGVGIKVKFRDTVSIVVATAVSSGVGTGPELAVWSSVGPEVSVVAEVATGLEVVPAFEFGA